MRQLTITFVLLLLSSGLSAAQQPDDEAEEREVVAEVTLLGKNKAEIEMLGPDGEPISSILAGPKFSLVRIPGGTLEIDDLNSADVIGTLEGGSFSLLGDFEIRISPKNGTHSMRMIVHNAHIDYKPEIVGDAIRLPSGVDSFDSR